MDISQLATKEDLKRFATKADLKNLATKKDLERFVTKADFDAGLKRLEESIGNLLSEALQLIDARFNRIEDKLDRAIARIDIHDVDIREIQRAA